MLETIAPWSTAGQLADLLRERLVPEQRLVSFSEIVPPIDPILFLANGRLLSNTSFYWERPEDRFAIVGIGSAFVIRPTRPDRFQQVAEVWEQLLFGWNGHGEINGLGIDLPGPMLLGGFAFDPLQPLKSCAWQDFGNGSMFLPEIQLTCVDDQTYLTYNLILPEKPKAWSAEQSGELLDQRIEHLVRLRTLLFTPRSPLPLSVSTPMPHMVELLPAEEWQRIVQFATGQIQQGAFQKTVLAREVLLQFDKPVVVEATLERLRKVFSTACIFAVTQNKTCYIGATPERLVQVRGYNMSTVALAGSAPRGQDPDEDHRLGEELLNSPKNRAEHASVVMMLRKKLQPLCAHVFAADRPQLLKLANVQHLHTPIVGTLRYRANVLDLVQQLHPTPALGGYPVSQAVEFIRTHEHLDRGWYAGPIGWLNASGEGDFCVAIRSALVTEDNVHLFTGCGIVAASNPATEYQESGWKLQGMIKNLVVQS